MVCRDCHTTIHTTAVGTHRSLESRLREKLARAVREEGTGEPLAATLRPDNAGSNPAANHVT